MKRCTKCGIEKPMDEFYKYKTRKVVYRTVCKSCIKEQNKKCRLDNLERNKASVRKWHLENPERVKALHKKWYFENHEKVKELTEKWRLENPEKYALSNIKSRLKKQIGETPPPELVEVKLLINKTKRLCKTLKN
jgi:hypothetical protein